MKEDTQRAAWGFRLGVVALLIGAGLLVPRGWVDNVTAYIARERPARVDVFDATSAALDAALEADAPLDAATRGQILARRHQLIARRLIAAGPMSGPEVARLLDELPTWDAELEGQPAASHAPIRRAQAARLAAALPRMAQEAAYAALRHFDARWAHHGLDTRI
jgi:hypothetical protein